jgi:IS30 family transposase
MRLIQEGSKPSRKGKHVNWEERIQIETLHREGFSSTQIGERLDRPARTIRREIRRGWLLYRTGQSSSEYRYNAVRGKTVYEQAMRSKINKKPMDPQRQEYIRLHIIEKRQSPEVVAAEMKKERPEQAVCFKTIYNLIDRNLIPGVSNESLWDKRKRGKKHKKVHRQRKRPLPVGHSIENRPKQAEDRKEIGHWEIDLVVGGQGKGRSALLTLTERKTRKQIIRKLKDKTQVAVIRAINQIERQMGKEAFRLVFKSITADNGSEFLDYEAFERSVLGKGSRTRIYYAHPYSSWERGSNENANRIIRRFIPKGCDISQFSHKQIQAIEEWINNYPRKILDFETAEARFIKELAS